MTSTWPMTDSFVGSLKEQIEELRQMIQARHEPTPVSPGEVSPSDSEA
jgi:hypothetical protein